MNDNVITATIRDSAEMIRTRPLYQYDYGMILQLAEDVPAGVEVEFSNDKEQGEAISAEMDGNLAAIPDSLLRKSGILYAWALVHEGQSRSTIASIAIPVKPRAKAER